MAIQQVGGQGVYVITGSGRDPRRTSNGQSWADLVTKQKYMLYKSAYDQAMREYEAGAITDKERQKRIDQLRKDIRQERTEIARLERGELTENQLRERQEQRLKAELGITTVRSPLKDTDDTGTDEIVDTGIPLIKDYERTLQKREKELRGEKVKAQRLVKDIEKNQDFSDALDTLAEGLPLIKSYEKTAYERNKDSYEKAKNDLNKVETNLKNTTTDLEKIQRFDTQEDFEAYYRKNILKGADPSTTRRKSKRSQGTVTTKQIKEGALTALPDVDYSERIKKRQERIGDIERQILELEAESGEEPVDVIQRTKEIGEERYGLGQPRRRLFGRRAEMDALGMEPEVEPQPEEVDVVAEEVAKGEVVDRPITAPTAQRYTVKEGDTLGGIAEQYYGDPARFTDIAQASGIDDPNRIEVGQQLTIPQDQPQMPTAPVAEPMVEDVVEEQTIAPIQPKPAQTEIGDALRQVEMDRQAQEEMRLNQQLPEATPPSLAPAPTPTAMPSIRKLGRMRSYKEAMGGRQPQRRRPLPPLQQIRAAFDPVRNLGRREKQQVGMNLLQQAKQAYGVSSPEYQKAKAQVLSELGKALDPKKARQMKVVQSLQDNAPSQYSRLGDDIRGLSEDSKRMVVQLFPVSDDTKLDEVERLYKNAQQQIRLSIPNKSQKKKALDMLDLMYMAVISDKR